MAHPTYGAQGLVLKRTKLGESDVIVTLLTTEGSQIRAVAKGARKPTSSFASRLELFSVCDLLLVSGKNLDIVKEARLVEGHAGIRGDLDKTAAASAIVDLLCRATDVGTTTPNLYAMTVKALGFMDACGADQALVLAAAQQLKALGLLGFRPSFASCVGCGMDLSGVTHLGTGVRFSFTEGGVVCPLCAHDAETMPLDPRVVEWGQSLLFSTFEDIAGYEVPASVVRGLLRFLQQWIRIQLSLDLKSLDFLFSFEATFAKNAGFDLKRG